MEPTQTTDSTHTSSDPQTDGGVTNNFTHEWTIGREVSDDLAIFTLLDQAIQVLCPELAYWEVRLARDPKSPKWDAVEAVTLLQHGNTAYFLFNPTCGEDVRESARYLEATVLHEVLHVTFYMVEHGIECAFDDDDNLGDVLDVAVHQLIDTLAWRLVDYVFPKQFNDTQEEEKNAVPEESCTDDCGDVRVDHDCSCAG